MAIDEFTLTVFTSGASLSAQLECPAFVDREDDFSEVSDALLWAQQRIAGIDPLAVFDDPCEDDE